MGGPRRHFERDKLYYLTNQTIRGQALFTPNDEITEIVSNNLAWAADVHDIDVVSFAFVPDGFGLLVRTRHLNISDFMCEFEGLTAREINAVHGQTGKFFAGRFDCTEVEEDMQLEVLANLLRSPHTRGFVDHPREWEGASSWQNHRSGEPLVGERVDRVQARELRRANPELSYDASLELATSTHVVHMAPLPVLEHLSPSEYRATIVESLESRVAPVIDAVRDAADDDVGTQPETLDLGEVEARTLYSLHSETLKFEVPVGMETVKEWPPTYSISKVRRRQPLYLTRNSRRRRRFHEERWQRSLDYAWAAKRLRHNIGTPKFPHGMIPPHKTRPVGATRPPPVESRRVHPKLSA